MKLLQKPINCYNHRTRYRALIFLHVIDAITFIIRLILVCMDLSKSKEEPSNVAYPLIIFFLEIISTLPFFISNILYFVLCCFKNELFRDDQHPICCHRRTALRLATLTCFSCQWYQYHPQGIQLTRVVILMLCFMIRFIAFILGASCATTFNPRCVPYTVVSSLALVPSLLTLSIEWFHFHLLWNFQPNIGNNLTHRRDRSHLRFISDRMTNEKRAYGYRISLCEKDEQCNSNSLNHTILYHSIRKARVENKSTIIAYHVTTTELAIGIAQNGFPVDWRRQMNSDIYFTRSVEGYGETGTTDHSTIICVRLSLGDVVQVRNEDEFDFSRHNTQSQTLEFVPSGKIKVRFPGQIENWVIILPTEMDEEFNLSYYDGCI